MSNFPEKKHYGVVRFNVIIVTKGWVDVSFQEKARMALRFYGHHDEVLISPPPYIHSVMRKLIYSE